MLGMTTTSPEYNVQEKNLYFLTCPFNETVVFKFIKQILRMVGWEGGKFGNTGFFFKFNLFYFSREGKGGRETLLVAFHQHPVEGTEPTTQVCSLTRNWTSNLSLCRRCPTNWATQVRARSSVWCSSGFSDFVDRFLYLNQSIQSWRRTNTPFSCKLLCKWYSSISLKREFTLGINFSVCLNIIGNYFQNCVLLFFLVLMVVMLFRLFLCFHKYFNKVAEEN